jgi:hypothetical protein
MSDDNLHDLAGKLEQLTPEEQRAVLQPERIGDYGKTRKTL